jgi:hypothetical protein
MFGALVTMDNLNSERRLLPPSPDPFVPEGVRPHYPVWYEPPVLPQPGDSRFFVIKQGYKRLTSFQWDSTELPEEIFPLDGDMDGVPFTMKSPKKMPTRPNDWVNGGYRLISRRALNILLKFDPEAIRWRPVISEFDDGKMETYFIEIRRRIKAIDFANSRILFKRSEGYDAYPASAGPARLLPDIPRHIHIFSDVRKRTAMFVSSDIRDAFMDLKPRPNNIVFDDPGAGLPF